MAADAAPKNANQLFWKWTIRDRIIDELYKIPGKNLHKLLCDLVKRVGQDDPEIKASGAEVYLYFRGTRYYSKEAGFQALAFDNTIDYRQAYPNEEQTIELEKTLQLIDELKNENRVIENYLNKVINLANTVEDVKALVPTSAHKFICMEDSSPQRTLSQERIDQLRQQTLKFAKLLNERILINFVNKED